MAFRTRESLDTNIILRLILNDVPEKRSKIVKLLCRPDVTYHVADLVVIDAVSILECAGRTREQIVRYFEELFKRMNLQANYALFEQVFPMYLQDIEMSFNDCCLSVYAALNEAEPLWTTDQEFAMKSPTAKMV